MLDMKYCLFKFEVISTETKNQLTGGKRISKKRSAEINELKKYAEMIAKYLDFPSPVEEFERNILDTEGEEDLLTLSQRLYEHPNS